MSIACLLLTLSCATAPLPCSHGKVGTYNGVTLCCDPRCVVCAARGCVSKNYKTFGGSSHDAAASSNISDACCLTSLSRRPCLDERDTLCLITPRFDYAAFWDSAWRAANQSGEAPLAPRKRPPRVYVYDGLPPPFGDLTQHHLSRVNASTFEARWGALSRRQSSAQRPLTRSSQSHCSHSHCSLQIRLLARISRGSHA